MSKRSQSLLHKIVGGWKHWLVSLIVGFAGSLLSSLLLRFVDYRFGGVSGLTRNINRLFSSLINKSADSLYIPSSDPLCPYCRQFYFGYGTAGAVGVWGVTAGNNFVFEMIQIAPIPMWLLLTISITIYVILTAGRNVIKQTLMKMRIKYIREFSLVSGCISGFAAFASIFIAVALLF